MNIYKILVCSETNGFFGVKLKDVFLIANIFLFNDLACFETLYFDIFKDVTIFHVHKTSNLWRQKIDRNNF